MSPFVRLASKRSPLVLACVAVSCVDTATRAASAPKTAAASTSVEDRVVQVIEVDQVWAGHPVGFSLFSTEKWQLAAYYDAERRMTVARRRLDERVWTKKSLPTTLGWDSHNHVVLAVEGPAITSSIATTE